MPSSPIRWETAHGVHVGAGGELLGQLDDHLGRRRVADVLELGHRPAAVVVADDAGEGDDGAGGLVGHGVLVLGHRERRVHHLRDHGADGTRASGGDKCTNRRGTAGRRGRSDRPARCSRPR